MIKRLLLVCATLVLLTGIGIGVLVAVAPWLDGPVLHVAGGPFKQTSVPYSQLNLAALADAGSVEIEVRGLPRPSILVGVLVRDGVPYVPATLRPEEKRWPAALLEDPRMRLRSNGVVVDVIAERVTDSVLHRTLSEQGASKYAPSYFEPDRTWYFRLQPEG